MMAHSPLSALQQLLTAARHCWQQTCSEAESRGEGKVEAGNFENLQETRLQKLRDDGKGVNPP